MSDYSETNLANGIQEIFENPGILLDQCMPPQIVSIQYNATTPTKPKAIVAFKDASNKWVQESLSAGVAYEKGIFECQQIRGVNPATDPLSPIGGKRYAVHCNNGKWVIALIDEDR